MLSVLFIFFCFSQEPTIKITTQDERELYGTTFASEKLNVQTSEQSLYRDSTDLLSLLSNTTSSGGTNRIRFLQIRGIGEVSQYENTPTSSITYLIDGVDVSGVLAHWPIVDTSNLYAEKQPASVLYGGYAIGGVVETQLKHAVDSPDLSKDKKYFKGSVDSRKGHGASFGLPISEHRLSVHYNNEAGYIKNSYTDKPGNSRKEVYGSFVSDWNTSERWNIESTVLWTNFNNRYDMWSIYNNNITSSDRPGKDDLSMIGASLRLQYKWSPNIQVHLWSSATASETLYSYDSDWSNNAYWNTVPGWSANYDYYDEFLRNRKQFQSRWSVQISDFVLGVHWQNLSEDSDTKNFKNGLQRSHAVGNFNQSSFAVHTGYKWRITDSTHWSTSARWDTVRTQFQDHTTYNEDFSDPQFAFSSQVEHEWAQEVQLFATVRSGYKNPIINIDPDTPLINRRVGSERNVHFEIGQKYQKKNWHLAQNLFFRLGTRQQVRVSRQLVASDPSSFVYYYDNAAETEGAGYEWSVQKVFSSGGQVKMSLGLLRARFNEYTFDGKTLSQREVAHAPKSTWAVQWSESFWKTWKFVVQTEGRSAFYYSNNHDQKSSSYALGHLAVHYERSGYQWDLGVRNIFDKNFGIRAFYFANEPPDFEDKLYVQSGAPQTFYVNYISRF